MGEAKNNKTVKGEIITPAELDRILERSHGPDTSALDGLLERFERLLEQSNNFLDLDIPESWFQELFGGMDSRIAMKTERGRAITALIQVFNEHLEEFEQVEHKLRAIHQAQYDRYIDRLRAARIALEEKQKFNDVADKSQRERSVEWAKAKAEISKYDAIAERERRSALPPPPPPAPPPPPPTPAEIRAAERKRLQDELDRLKAQEEMDLDRAERSFLVGSVDLLDEQQRIKNMYFDARNKIREQLRKVL